MTREFALNRERGLHLLGHKAQRLLLHGFGIGQVEDPDRQVLADPPTTAAGLSEGEHRIAALEEDDGREVEQIQTGLDQVGVAEQTIVLAGGEVFFQPIFPLFWFDRLASEHQRGESLLMQLVHQSGHQVAGAGVFEKDRHLTALFAFGCQDLQQPFFLGQEVDLQGRSRGDQFLHAATFEIDPFAEAATIRIGQEALQHFAQEPHIPAGERLAGGSDQGVGEIEIRSLQRVIHRGGDDDFLVVGQGLADIVQPDKGGTLQEQIREQQGGNPRRLLDPSLTGLAANAGLIPVRAQIIGFVGALHYPVAFGKSEGAAVFETGLHHLPGKHPPEKVEQIAPIPTHKGAGQRQHLAGTGDQAGHGLALGGAAALEFMDLVKDDQIEEALGEIAFDELGLGIAPVAFTVGRPHPGPAMLADRGLVA